MATPDRVERIDLALDREYRFVATYPGLPDSEAIVLDEPPPLGGGQGPNPAALLATAVANCLASSLLFCARKARVSIDDLQVHAAAHINRNPAGRLRLHRIEVMLEPAMAEADRLERCKALFEDFCIVTAAVRDGVQVDVSIAPRTDAAPLEQAS